MDIKTFRAKSMRDALELVRRDLGPSAAVLHTREVNSGPLSRLVFGRKYEVAASADVNVPSRLPAEVARNEERDVSFEVQHSIVNTPSAHFNSESPGFDDYRVRYRNDFRRQVAGHLHELQL